jgi:hypothetical protein
MGISVLHGRDFPFADSRSALRYLYAILVKQAKASAQEVETLVRCSNVEILAFNACR